MNLPKHLNMTERQFKAWKRRQFKDLCAYIKESEIATACAYLPKDQYEKLANGIDLIFKTRDELRPWWKRA